MVVIDQQVAFVGGLDLTYGRWDTFQHHLFDYEDEAVMEVAKSKIESNIERNHSDGNAEQGNNADGGTKASSINIGIAKVDQDYHSISAAKADTQEIRMRFSENDDDVHRECVNDIGKHGGGNFPSKDYYNCRVKDFEDVTNWEDSVDRTKSPACRGMTFTVCSLVNLLVTLDSTLFIDGISHLRQSDHLDALSYQLLLHLGCGSTPFETQWMNQCDKTQSSLHLGHLSLFVCLHDPVRPESHRLSAQERVNRQKSVVQIELITHPNIPIVLIVLRLALDSSQEAVC